MTLTETLIVRNKGGIHARPASLIVTLANKYTSFNKQLMMTRLFAAKNTASRKSHNYFYHVYIPAN